ncbi:hypothetical protein HZC00_04760 [Candidatus Kaiserbacteria bacterium]|nr:hypothetical protein [Candidatus Kaiserbacteria bacterium]
MLAKQKIASFAVSSIIVLVPALSLAAGGLVTVVPGASQGSHCNDVGGCQSICDFAQLAQNVLNDSIYLAIVVSAIFIAWAGWQYMTANGQPYKIKAGKKLFFNIFVGLLLAVGAWLLVDVLISGLTGSSGLQWNRIC